MNSESNATTPSDAQPATEGAGPATASKAEFQFGRVVKVLAPIVILLAGGAVFIGFFDGISRVERWMRPPLLPVRGQVFFAGEPLREGQVTTFVKGLPGSLGVIDKNGEFTLLTDVDGSLLEGVYPGEHTVAVAAYEPLKGAAAPPLKTPASYASLATTPLRISVKRSSGKQEFTFNLAGDPPAAVPPAGPPTAEKKENDQESQDDPASTPVPAPEGAPKDVEPPPSR
jgi:hypothetical protein